MNRHQVLLALCHWNSLTSFTELGFSRYSAPAESSPSARHEVDWFSISGSSWTCPCSRRTRRQSSGRRSGRQTQLSGHCYCKRFSWIQIRIFWIWFIYPGCPLCSGWPLVRLDSRLALLFLRSRVLILILKWKFELENYVELMYSSQYTVLSSPNFYFVWPN